MIPGEYRLKQDDIICHPDRETIQLTIVNRGDRPVQIGSHVHFYEVNAQLDFDRSKAYGTRLHIPAGTAVRFEPGEEKPVELTTFGGKRKIVGFNNLTNGTLDQPPDLQKLKNFLELYAGTEPKDDGEPT
ncbi:urease subunit beta [Paenibacillus sp. Marseille-Q4541]|uniref:urease subunit beta n=1 Tax=Paenibacillus sp. Marseille-Q4541 TaxID=2831522 RepID=UPI001BAC88CC|nr:urease subunit beta [Paenibacillus sp. Marseille-Q4541]